MSTDDSFTEPNSNIENVVAMNAMEYLYFTSDDLEYYPNDWTPFCDSGHPSLPRVESIDMMETSLFLSDALYEESPLLRMEPFSPIKRNRTVCPSISEALIPSMVWYESMPVAYPVSHVEFQDFMNQYKLDCVAAWSTEYMCNITFAINTKRVSLMSTDLSDGLLLKYEKHALCGDYYPSIERTIEKPSVTIVQFNTSEKDTKIKHGNIHSLVEFPYVSQPHYGTIGTKINRKDGCGTSKKLNMKKTKDKINIQRVARSYVKSRPKTKPKQRRDKSFDPYPNIPMNSIINRKNPRIAPSALPIIQHGIM
jgi:hypothetical protein